MHISRKARGSLELEGFFVSLNSSTLHLLIRELTQPTHLKMRSIDGKHSKPYLFSAQNFESRCNDGRSPVESAGCTELSHRPYARTGHRAGPHPCALESGGQQGHPTVPIAFICVLNQSTFTYASQWGPSVGCADPADTTDPADPADPADPTAGPVQPGAPSGAETWGAGGGPPKGPTVGPGARHDCPSFVSPFRQQH
jgi:hypothetical protein